MPVWLIRAGSYGEHEKKFLQEKRVYVTRENLNIDISKLSNRLELVSFVAKLEPWRKHKHVSNLVSQIWPFAHLMEIGDLVVLPLKNKPAIQIGEVSGSYHFEAKGPNPYFHWRPVQWIGQEIPRTHFSQDLLHTFGAFRTIARVRRNNAEARIRTMWSNGWTPEYSSIKKKS